METKNRLKQCSTYLITAQEYDESYKLLAPYIYTNGVLTISSKKYMNLPVLDAQNQINNHLAFQIWINSELSSAIVSTKYDRTKELLPYWKKGLRWLCNGHPVLHQLMEQTTGGPKDRFIRKKQLFKLVINQPIVKNLIECSYYLDKYGNTPAERCQTLWQKEVIHEFTNSSNL